MHTLGNERMPCCTGGGQYHLEKRGSVLLGYESPALPPSPHSFFAPGFPFYQVYLTKLSCSWLHINLSIAYCHRYRIGDCKGSGLTLVSNER